MNLDLESSAPLRRRPVTATSTAAHGTVNHGPPGLPPRHPLQIMKRCAIIAGTCYGIHDLKVFHNLLHNPDVSHEWFKIGLATSIAVMAIKAYVELYEGKKKKKTVDYKNFKSVTHWTLLLIIASWISFHMAISPVYGFFKTWLIMVGFGYGILVQSALMIPVWGQNFISFVLMTFFLQQYK
ncbi:hypothetical protein ACHAXS_007777 [Conticribra weissflogii]